MDKKQNEQVLQKVRTHAYQNLPMEKRQTTHLYLDSHVYQKGETIGPDFQKIVAQHNSLLVFADHDPHANFGHDCSYLLYDAQTGQLHQEVAARFPPIKTAKAARTLTAFHEPMPFQETAIQFKLWPPIWWPPIVIPEGARYAVLYAGMANKRHLNDMEFLYRTLVDRYAFDPAHIQVLNYDGTHNTQDGVQTVWPGDGTPYRIHVTGQGNQAGFEAAIDALKPKLKSLDTLLIHCNNHGDYDGMPGTSFLCTYPNWGKYYNGPFTDKLAQLPHFRQLLVMLEQCNSGGFNAPIIAKSPAGATSVASAAIESQSSYVSADGNWDPFARDWIAAQAGHTCFGTALDFNPDSDMNGRIEAEEAYGYANAVRDPRDSPNFSESSEAGGDIHLGQDYMVWYWWRTLLREELEPYYAKLPPHEYYERLGHIQSELTRMTKELDKTSAALKKEMGTKVKALVTSVFSLASQD